MKKMRLLRTCLAAVLCLSLLSACGKSADGGAAAPGGKDTLVVAVANEPTTMDPYGKNDSTSANFKVQVFDTCWRSAPTAKRSPASPRAGSTPTTPRWCCTSATGSSSTTATR